MYLYLYPYPYLCLFGVCIFVKTVEPAIKSSIIDICQRFGFVESRILKNYSIGAEPAEKMQPKAIAVPFLLTYVLRS